MERNEVHLLMNHVFHVFKYEYDVLVPFWSIFHFMHLCSSLMNLLLPSIMECDREVYATGQYSYITEANTAQ